MAKKSKSVADRTFPWFQSGFDLEGIVGFLAAWLLGILLGMLWGPLFWLAFIPGLVLLFATRTAERVSPDEPGLIEVLRRSRPWWMVPIVILLAAAVLLIATDIVPLRNLAYSVM